MIGLIILAPHQTSAAAEEKFSQEKGWAENQ